MNELARESKKFPDLADLEFKIPKFVAADELRIDEPDILEANFNGTPLVLSISTESWYEEGSSFIHLDVEVSAKGKLNLANLGVWVVKDKDGCKAGTTIENTRGEVKGLGMALWEKSLPFLQKISNKHGIVLTHEVRRKPTDNLEIPAWNKLFFPMFKKYGYVQGKVPDHWEKVYNPQK